MSSLLNSRCRLRMRRVASAPTSTLSYTWHRQRAGEPGAFHQLFIF